MYWEREMQKTFKNITIVTMLACLSLGSLAAIAGPKTYTEDEFLNNFSGKSKKVIIEKLGAPARKELSVKPTNAENIVGQKEDSKAKRVNIEMWYYKNLVKYDPKRTYKETEVTLVNDRVMNIAFFNNK